jgi:hypothetical protein
MSDRSRHSVTTTCACFKESSRRSHISIGPWVGRALGLGHTRRRDRHDLLCQSALPTSAGVNLARVRQRGHALRSVTMGAFQRTPRISCPGRCVADANAPLGMWLITIWREGRLLRRTRWRPSIDLQQGAQCVLKSFPNGGRYLTLPGPRP